MTVRPAHRGSVSAHRPLPAVLVVAPFGPLDEQTRADIDERLGGCGPEVLHAVLDLRSVDPLTPSGVQALLDLDRLATRRGLVLHLSGAPGHPLLRKLFSAHVLRSAPWCDELLAFRGPRLRPFRE